MTSIREAIIEEGWAVREFVSYRILISLRDTYIVSRDVEMQKVANSAIVNPKTLKEGLDSFLDLFSVTQKQYLKDVSDYNSFVNNVIPSKDKMPLSKLNTDEELDKVNALIKNNEAKLNVVNE